MKALKLVVFGIVLFFAGAVQAQISVHFNIGSRPEWAPVGYEDSRYYSFQRTIGERPGKEYYRDRYDRERNQVNRGRYNRIDGNDRRGDASYDRRGNERNQRFDRRRDNGNDNRNNDRDNENDKE